jgi:hypothetical protein
MRPGCMPASQAPKFMAEKFQEGRIAAALGADNSLVEIYTSDKGTWTLIVTKPDGSGMACMVASGDTWTDIAPAIPQSGPVYRLLPAWGRGA